MKEIYDRGCTKCRLGLEKHVKIHCCSGRGKVTAPIMLIGEAPGGSENLTGFAFTGPSGDLLFDRLRKVGIVDYVFITNVCKCQPPGNRPPKADEVDTCTNLYLDHELSQSDAKIIVALGMTAFTLFSSVNGETMRYKDRIYNVVRSPHPSICLNSVRNDQKLVEALTYARDFVFLKMY